MTTAPTEQGLLPCPFCGAEPVFPKAADVLGSCYDCGCVECGIAEMSLQIIDCFDHPRDHVHDSWNEKTHQYGIEFIEIARQQAIKQWNTRTPHAQAESVPQDADTFPKCQVCGKLVTNPQATLCSLACADEDAESYNADL